MAKEFSEKRYIHRDHVKCISVFFRRPGILSLFSASPPHPCAVSDINWRGLRFYAPCKLRKGTIIKLRFDCPLDVQSSPDGLPTQAWIAWQEWSKSHKAWRTGARFVDMRESQRESVLKMIDSAASHEKRFQYDQEML